jgi:hypothetical protein
MRIPLFFLVVSSVAAVYQLIERYATQVPAGERPGFIPMPGGNRLAPGWSIPTGPAA